MAFKRFLCISIFSFLFINILPFFVRADVAIIPEEAKGKGYQNSQNPTSLVDMNNYKLLERKGGDRLRYAGFVRLKAKEDAAVGDNRDVYLVDFIDKDLQTTKKGPGSRARLSLEKRKDLDETSSFSMLERKNEYKTDLCVGYKVTPFTEILLGRGFILERKEDTKIETHDDGWRMKFKVNF